MKTRLLVLMALIALSGPVMAGETENIQSCIKAIKDNTGKLADEFDVQYESHLIAFDIARWPGIDCEVMLGEVQNLAVDGKTFIVEGWPSPEAKAAYEALERDVSAASDQLATRQKIIQERLADAYEKLRLSSADISETTAFVRQGIDKALGH